MRKLVYKISFILLFLHAQLGAIIFESNDLSDINKYVDKNLIVVFDIDHTIAENTVDLDTWVTGKIEFLQKQGLSPVESVQLALSMYYTLQHVVELKMIGNSKEVIDNLQEKNIPVMALTNRSIPVLKRTVKQIKKMNIDFSRTALCDEDLKVGVTHQGKFSKGIIFCGANDKGKMLFSFFDRVRYNPEKIIFVDDKLKYVQSVQAEAEKRGLDFVGIRFSLQDEKKKVFDFDKVEQELKEVKVKIGMEPMSTGSDVFFG